MKAFEHTDFNPLSPEYFKWGYLDSVTLHKLAESFASRIIGESLLIPSQRILTPGLREALNAIAKEASL
jgi:hypothetical protein